MPKHWQDQVREGLENDVRMGIIEKVPVNTPTTWLSRMVCVPKQNGEPRRTVDFKALNKASDRQTHHTRSPFKMAMDVPKYTKKSVLDVWNAYHAVPIREEDKHKTSFITEDRRYRYCRAPQGFLASGDGFTHRESIIARDIKNKVTLVDDSLLWDNTVEESFTSVCRFLEAYGKAGLVVNGDKFQFCQDIVDFAGMEVTSTSVRPSKKFLDTVAEMPLQTLKR